MHIVSRRISNELEKIAHQNLTFIRVVALRHPPHLDIVHNPHPHPLSILNLCSRTNIDWGAKFCPAVHRSDVDTSSPQRIPDLVGERTAAINLQETKVRYRRLTQRLN